MTNEELVNLIKAGDTTLMLNLYQQNTGMMYYLCKRYTNSEHPIEDLMQECYIGMVDAINAYEPDRGSFINCLKIHCKKVICAYMRDSRVLRPPQKYRAYKRLIQSNPYITDEELINELHTTVGELERIKAYQQPISIDVPLNEDSDSLKDLIPCATYSLEDDTIDKIFEDSKKEVWNIIADNTAAKANRCIQGYYRYGKTFKEIAELEGGVSPSGIRELINTNLKNLRRGRAAKILKSKFMEVEATMYHGSITSFKYTDSSIQEKIVLRKEFYEQKYKVK
jgi:RNA polymerase sigma factor (sigma-70 family)